MELRIENFDGSVWRKLKAEAARRGITLREIVHEVLRAATEKLK